MPGKVFQFKITLMDTSPSVWRRILVSDDLSFWKLHEILQVTMGWMHSHLMQFEAGDRVFGRPDWDDTGDDDSEDARRVKVRQVLEEPGDRMFYLYDFGDHWQHLVELEKVLDVNDVRHYVPRCIAGQNAAPPEDCGGVHGFEHLKRVIADPEDEEHLLMVGWLDQYYPNYAITEFSLGAVNKILNLGASRYLKMISKLYMA